MKQKKSTKKPERSDWQTTGLCFFCVKPLEAQPGGLNVRHTDGSVYCGKGSLHTAVKA